MLAMRSGRPVMPFSSSSAETDGEVATLAGGALPGPADERRRRPGRTPRRRRRRRSRRTRPRRSRSACGRSPGRRRASGTARPSRRSLTVAITRAPAADAELDRRGAESARAGVHQQRLARVRDRPGGTAPGASCGTGSGTPPPRSSSSSGGASKHGDRRCDRVLGDAAERVRRDGDHPPAEPGARRRRRRASTTPQRSMPSVNGGSFETETSVPRQRAMSLKLSAAAATRMRHLAGAGLGHVDVADGEHLAGCAVSGHLQCSHLDPLGSMPLLSRKMILRIIRDDGSNATAPDVGVVDDVDVVDGPLGVDGCSVPKARGCASASGPRPDDGSPPPRSSWPPRRASPATTVDEIAADRRRSGRATFFRYFESKELADRDRAVRGRGLRAGGRCWPTCRPSSVRSRRVRAAQAAIGDRLRRPTRPRCHEQALLSTGRRRRCARGRCTSTSTGRSSIAEADRPALRRPGRRTIRARA